MTPGSRHGFLHGATPGPAAAALRRTAVAAVAAMAAMVAMAGPAFGASPAEIQAGYEAQARQSTAAFNGFSAARGEQFYRSTHGNEWSCASCHGATPTGPGRHAKTGKTISPLAPSADAQRFSDKARVEKWFRRNCNDVMGRECTPLEKGDVMAFLLRFGQ
jgi:hypothetical protein